MNRYTTEGHLQHALAIFLIIGGRVLHLALEDHQSLVKNT